MVSQYILENGSPYIYMYCVLLYQVLGTFLYFIPSTVPSTWYFFVLLYQVLGTFFVLFYQVFGTFVNYCNKLETGALQLGNEFSRVKPIPHKFYSPVMSTILIIN